MRNVLLAGVSADELDRLASRLGRTEFSAGQCLQAEGQRLERVCFPESGLVSLMGGTGDRRLEAAMVGREGMIGAGALLGVPVSSHEAVARAPGMAWTLPVAELTLIRRDLPDWHERLLGFVGAWTAHLEQTIWATGRCTVEQRLARWLLLANDRLSDDTVEITHDCLATILGVRRPGVTVALHLLEGELTIRSTRGRIVIRDRDRLRDIAGDAYREPPADIRPRAAQRLGNGSTQTRHPSAVAQ